MGADPKPPSSGLRKSFAAGPLYCSTVTAALITREAPRVSEGVVRVLELGVATPIDDGLSPPFTVTALGEGRYQLSHDDLRQPLTGTVGQPLAFAGDADTGPISLLISRLDAEYKVAAHLEPSPFATARWLKGDDAALNAFESFNRPNLAKDRDGDLVFMARSAWDVGYQQEKNPELVFSATKER